MNDEMHKAVPSDGPMFYLLFFGFKGGATWGWCPILAADLISFSNLGHASGSISSPEIFDSKCFAGAFLAFFFAGGFAMRLRTSRLWVVWASLFSPKNFEKVSRDYTQFIIGGITISWASIETAIGALTLVAYQNGGNAFAESMPRSLSRKTEFLKTSFKKLGFLEPTASDGRALLARVDTLAEDRHWAVHGTVMEYTGPRYL